MHRPPRISVRSNDGLASKFCPQALAGSRAMSPANTQFIRLNMAGIVPLVVDDTFAPRSMTLAILSDDDPVDTARW